MMQVSQVKLRNLCLMRMATTFKFNKSNGGKGNFKFNSPKPIGTLYYMPMEFNDKRVNALYDPGAEMTSISSSFFRRFFSGVGVRPMVRNISVALKMFQ